MAISGVAASVAGPVAAPWFRGGGAARLQVSERAGSEVKVLAHIARQGVEH
jgi:hypothetical protein